MKARTGRTLQPAARALVKEQLEELLAARTRVEYGAALTSLGESLGAAVKRKYGASAKPFALVSTPEDADYLVSGMLRALRRESARLVCYWTDRSAFVGENDVATVVQEYVDPRLEEGASTVIVAKSIIATSCVVRTNLEQLLVKLDPDRIIIAAPVMLKGADVRLKASFPASIAARFEFVSFAIDSKREDGVVVPGVGGMVEERLGYQRSRRLPKLVSEWQRAIQ